MSGGSDTAAASAAAGAPNGSGAAAAGGAAPPLRVLELYSGIGGARAALERWAAARGRQVQVVAAFDSNAQANAAYQLNFGDAPSSRGIEHLTAAALDKFDASLWMLSPPCQPHTLGGGRAGGSDVADRRSDSLHHLCELLPQLRRPPDALLLENVPGFAESEARAEVGSALAAAGFSVTAAERSPAQFGVPNERRRFYLLARRGRELAPVPEPPARVPRTLGQLFSEWGCPAPGTELSLPAAHFAAHPAYRFDVAALSDRRSACVTKGYGESHRGTGSLVLLRPLPGAAAADQSGETVECVGAKRRRSPTADSVDWTAPAAAGGVAAAPPQTASEAAASPAASEAQQPQWVCGAELARLGDGAARLFSPEELLALLGFPRGFRFPDRLSRKQRYRLCGNSLSCDVHAELLGHLLGD
eukprot:TRINITY_DN2612_c0_g1_i2.p1 TRINITY_DN2612_c0_g1~~TRINITY_DN2612_c0_g1_i2.p1  ORF type:complete len:443 (+),score=105.46 TRINITY_DN2612_c0_g1_i2:79-1329(+)